MYLAKKMTTRSLPEIGRRFANRDHTTVIHAVKTITRLIDMGIDSFLVASSLSGVVAQRLLRVVCPHCSTLEEPSKDEAEILEKNGFKPFKLKKAQGCDICNQKGYKGRTAIFEILDVNEEIVKLVSNHAHEYEILEQARKDGTHLLIEAGIIKVRRGITTLEEVMRISLD